MAKKHFLKKLKRLSRPKKALLVALFSILVLASIPTLLIAFRTIWFVLYLATYKVTHCTNQKLPVKTTQSLHDMVIYKDSWNVCASTLDGQNPVNLINFLELHDNKADIGGGEFIALNTASNKMFFILNKFRSSKKYGVMLYEKNLGTGEIKKLLSYNPTEFSQDENKDTLVMSEDGQHVVYESEKGLMHYSLKSKRYRTLSENNLTNCAKTEYGIFEDTYSKNCYVYQIEKLTSDGTLEFISTKPEEGTLQKLKLFDDQSNGKTWFADNPNLATKGGVFVGQQNTYYWDSPEAPGVRSHQIKFELPELINEEISELKTSPDGQRLIIMTRSKNEKNEKVVSKDNYLWLVRRETLKSELIHKYSYEAQYDFFNELMDSYDIRLQWLKDSKNMLILRPNEKNGAGSAVILNTDTGEVTETKIVGSGFIGLTN